MIAFTNYRLCVLVALRPSVWLSDNCSGPVMDIHQDFSLALGTKHGEVRKGRVLPQFDPGFAAADGA